MVKVANFTFNAVNVSGVQAIILVKNYHHLKGVEKKFDINVRTVAAFRKIGKGHTAIETVCGFLNVPPDER